MTMSKNTRNRFWFPFILSVILSSGVYIGYNISKNKVQKIHFNIPDNSTNPIIETLTLINTYYVENPGLEEHYDEVVEKLISELDPHSYLITAKELKAINDEMMGSYEGIGIEFFVLNDTIQVITPIPGGPSEQLGILTGDKIIHVNDSIVAGVNISNEDVIKKLKGPKGTKVKVSIARNGYDKLIDFQIKRDKIPLYSVDAGFKIDENTGYIKIGRFSGQTYNEFNNKLKSLKRQQIDQLIIDLRQNPGGYLEEAVKIISELLGNKEEIVYIEGRAVEKQSYHAEKYGNFLNGKIAILIDEGSASASEILAGAIQDWDRGVIIGRRSFGKGLVQQQYQLSNGSAIRLTIAKYYTPSGRSIQRPYKKGNGDEYNNDFVQRFDDGELFNADDSLTLAKQDTTHHYYTKILNRPVYGGGGIVPDYHISIDTSYLNSFSLQVISSGWIQEFIYDYFNKHSKQFQKYASIEEFSNKYNISDNTYQSFIRFCKVNKKSNYTHLDNQHVKKEIQYRMKATLARQIFNNDGFLYITAQRDPAVLKAIEVFNMTDYPFE